MSNEKKSRRIAVIVPYRDRAEHLKQFIPAIKDYLSVRGIDYRLIIVEQTDKRAFNRAALLNIGASVAGKACTHYVMHDVDHLPINVDYTPDKRIIQLASNEFQKSGFLGAVTMFDCAAFFGLGGYNQFYFCRGEDNELSFHLRNYTTVVHERPGTYNVLPHARPWKEFDRALWLRAQRPRIVKQKIIVPADTRVFAHHDGYFIVRTNLDEVWAAYRNFIRNGNQSNNHYLHKYERTTKTGKETKSTS